VAVEITLSRKQQTAIQLLDDPTVTELLYPGITVGLGRKEISNLGKTTAQTLLTEVHPVLGVRDPDFKYRAPGSPQPGVYYRNRSSIVFIDLAPAPTDLNFDRFGSLGLTHVIIEEAGEVVKKARSVITSRKNRKLNREYGITGKAVLTCNPSPISCARRSTSPTSTSATANCRPGL
jgi:hypothetical protein